MKSFKYAILGMILMLMVPTGCQQETSNMIERPRVIDEAGNVVSQVRFPEHIDKTVIRVKNERGHLLTDQVTINGQKVGWFLVDTGANFTVLDRAAMDTAELSVDRRLVPMGEMGQPDGAYRIRSISVGNMTLQNHAIIVAKLPSFSQTLSVPLAGVLGGDVWGAAPFMVDYRESTLALYCRSAFHGPVGVHVEDLIMAEKPESGFMFASANPFASQPCVRGTINGIETLFLLDTGATTSVVLSPDFARAHQDWQDMARPVSVPNSLLAGGKYLPIRIGHIEMLGREWHAINTGLAMAGDWRPVVATAVPMASQTVGAQLLQDFRLTFDYAGGHIWADCQTRTSATTR
jgi:predicted aspartyl protease